MQELKQQIEHRQIESLISEQGRTPVPGMQIFQDTTDFMKLDFGDVLVLEDTPYFIIRNEKEVGFWMDGDPKYWVKGIKYDIVDTDNIEKVSNLLNNFLSTACRVILLFKKIQQ